jgi:hypothetical protein
MIKIIIKHPKGMMISVELNEQRRSLLGLCHSEEISNFSEYFSHQGFHIPTRK